MHKVTTTAPCHQFNLLEIDGALKKKITVNCCYIHTLDLFIDNEQCRHKQLMVVKKHDFVISKTDCHQPICLLYFCIQ